MRCSSQRQKGGPPNCGRAWALNQSCTAPESVISTDSKYAVTAYRLRAALHNANLDTLDDLTHENINVKSIYAGCFIYAQTTLYSHMVLYVPENSLSHEGRRRYRNRPPTNLELSCPLVARTNRESACRNQRG